MDGKSGILLILIITAFAACSSPVGVGNIGGSAGGSIIVTSRVYEEGLDVALSPASRTYKVGDTFQRNHLQVVFTTFQGVRRNVLNNCTIFIEDPDPIEVGDGGYLLETPGEKTIRVEYRDGGRDFEGQYTIDVGEPAASPVQTQTGTIIIEWKHLQD